MLGFLKNDKGEIDTNKFNIVKNEKGNINSIVYKKEYVFNLLKRRSIELAKRIKEKKYGK